MALSRIDTSCLRRKLQTVSSEAKELYLDSVVPCVGKPLKPLDFYRNFVAANKPVVVNNGLHHWPAISKWDGAYFREKIGHLEVTVTVTPNGYADAVTDGKFVMPEERRMPMSDFLDIIDQPSSANGVFYIQKQNSNLTDEFSSLLNDVDSEISWGTEAFGRSPDAVNFWMGDGRAITSKNYQAAVFKENKDEKFDITDDLDTGQVPWVAIDPLKPDLEKYPQYSQATPVTVTVHAGQMLYLPSLWFHHVQQSHGCIAVNYWYDMDYDIKYNYYKFMESIVELAK